MKSWLEASGYRVSNIGWQEEKPGRATSCFRRQGFTIGRQACSKNRIILKKQRLILLADGPWDDSTFFRIRAKHGWLSSDLWNSPYQNPNY
ncbi:hypothetical protein [Achromobacter sp. ESBL13]|uniref:hypothetical protein n=1 Tax=Achromobacter sp. ESBL13 TaxID=3077328 RepID=UPI002FC6DC50